MEFFLPSLLVVGIAVAVTIIATRYLVHIFQVEPLQRKLKQQEEQQLKLDIQFKRWISNATRYLPEAGITKADIDRLDDHLATMLDRYVKDGKTYTREQIILFIVDFYI